MSPPPLCLRVDPPYPDESLTSFLGRTAQVYCQPVTTLVRQLARGMARGGGRRDLDRWPPEGLLSVLAEAVPGWRSPLADFGGFRSWVLAPGARQAYCPTCFVEDLAAQRVPYFRQDWMAVLVTACWKHGTPLCQWQWVGSGARRLPPEWCFQAGFGTETHPAFFQADVDRLGALTRSIRPGGATGPDQGQALKLLWRLQQVLEKPAVAPMPASPDLSDDPEAHLRTCLHRLGLLAVTFSQAERECGPPAACMRPTAFGDWFGPHPPGLGPRQHEYREYAIRQGGEVSWRRTYLWFIVRTLAGCEPFASTHFREFQPWDPWRDWWARDVRPLCPAAFWPSIDFEATFLGRVAGEQATDIN